jgi:hypothetical protein
VQLVLVLEKNKWALTQLGNFDPRDSNWKGTTQENKRKRKAAHNREENVLELTEPTSLVVFFWVGFGGRCISIEKHKARC